MHRPRHVLLPMAALLLLTGCANPNVPDFMVQGRLPDFAGKGAAKSAPTVAQAPAPIARSAPMPAPSPSPPQVAAVAPPVTPDPIVAVPSPIPAAIPAPVATPAVTVPMPPEPAPAPLVAAAPPPPIYTGPIAGGFSRVTDKHLIEAVSTFAMEQAPNGYLLKSVKSMKSQVVAGTNYELCLRVRTPGHESNWIRQRLVKAVVWEHLDQTMELTSWNEVDTCE